MPSSASTAVSAGGRLVGAALTQRPGAYAAVLCSAPELDTVRAELFGIGALTAHEYGSARVPEELPWLLSQSPTTTCGLGPHTRRYCSPSSKAMPG